MKKFLALLIALLPIVPESGLSETLQQKFGQTWSCKMISAELDERYKECRACEIKQLEYDPDRLGEKCVPSLRAALERKLNQWGRNTTEDDDPLTKLANQQAQQQQLETEMKGKAASEKRRLRESDVSGGASRLPTNEAADQSKSLSNEMDRFEARQSGSQLEEEMTQFELKQQTDQRKRKAEEARKLANTKLFNFEDDKPSPPPAPASPPQVTQDDAPRDGITFVLSNRTNHLVQAAFHSQHRRVAWPGNDKGFSIPAASVKELRLRCIPGELICYGAMVEGFPDSYWGVGPFGDKACTKCCVTCGSGVSRHDLLPFVPNNENSASSQADETTSSRSSGVEVLGTALGVAGAILGSGGGTSYRAPPVPRGPAPRDRPSGVSGGR